MENPLRVVKVRTEDTAVIRTIVDELIDETEEKPSAEHLEVLLTDDKTYLLAAMWDDIVIGYALAYRFASLYSSHYLAYLYDIGVEDAYQRRGAGRLLIETMLTCLKADNVSELWLGTATDNVEGQGLFNSTGAIRTEATFHDFTYLLTEENF